MMRDIPPEFGPTVPTGEYLDVRDEARRLREELDNMKHTDNLRAMQMGFGPRRAATAALYRQEPREDIITDRYVLRDIGNRVYRFDTATGQTWVLEDGFVADLRYTLRWRLITDSAPVAGDGEGDGEGDANGD